MIDRARLLEERRASKSSSIRRVVRSGLPWLVIVCLSALPAASVPPPDADADGLPDIGDPCPIWPSPLGSTDSDADGIPDGCQCGDADEDGSLTSGDVTALVACFGNPGLCEPGLADTNDDGAITGSDLLALQDVLAGSQRAYRLTCGRRPEGFAVARAFGLVHSAIGGGDLTVNEVDGSLLVTNLSGVAPEGVAVSFARARRWDVGLSMTDPGATDSQFAMNVNLLPKSVEDIGDHPSRASGDPDITMLTSTREATESSDHIQTGVSSARQAINEDSPDVAGKVAESERLRAKTKVNSERGKATQIIEVSETEDDPVTIATPLSPSEHPTLNGASVSTEWGLLTIGATWDGALEFLLPLEEDPVVGDELIVAQVDQVPYYDSLVGGSIRVIGHTEFVVTSEAAPAAPPSSPLAVPSGNRLTTIVLVVLLAGLAWRFVALRR